MNMFVIAVEIVTTSHPGARAQMQYLAVPQDRVFQIVLVTMNPFYPIDLRFLSNTILKRIKLFIFSS